MKKFQFFTLHRPFGFGLILISLYALLTTITNPVHYLFTGSEAGQLYGDAVSKFICFLLFLALFWRFGWLSYSGISRLGNLKTWLVVAGILVYLTFAKLYAFTGVFSPTVPRSYLVGPNLILGLSTGLVEETMFRGLVLVSMILAWGDTRRGLVKAILLSSLYFGLLQLINDIIRPPAVVLLQAAIVTLPGVLYAAVVLASRTLWPVIQIHGLTNAAVNIRLIGDSTYQETNAMWIRFAIALIPLIGFATFLTLKLPQPYRFNLDNGNFLYTKPLLQINTCSGN
jgi:membrane protease YdiL (CAAX protease family)